MQNSIKSLMIEDHGKLSALLNELEKNPRIKQFNEFKWNLEKHFFVEEKVIFELYSLESNEDLDKLLKEHKDILWLLESIEESIDTDSSEGIAELKIQLSEHAGFENDSFYPRLDEELSEDKKRLIIERCNEKIRC